MRPDTHARWHVVIDSGNPRPCRTRRAAYAAVRRALGSIFGILRDGVPYDTGLVKRDGHLCHF